MRTCPLAFVLVLASVTAATAARAEPPRTDAVHARLVHATGRGGRAVARDPDGAWSCALPCEIDVASGAELRVTLDDGEPQHVTVEGAPGETVEIVVGPKHRAGYYVGAAGMMVGGTALMAGGGFLMVGSMFAGFGSNQRQSGAPLAVGGVLAIGSGIGLLVWGIVRAADGGTAVEQRSPPPPATYESRSDAPARSEPPMIVGGAPGVQLGFSF
ncbi:MAG: hypothetical protein KF819_17175 [Labilithrix sp.]|nr:hypothetical protein [Labilithrix sp.]